MKETAIQLAKKVLNNYLEAGNHRKTIERYAILEAVYDIKGHFSIDQLGTLLEERNLRVSRATLYNTMRLFIKLRIVVRHHLHDGTKYEACYKNENHCHQICTVCGKVTELYVPEFVDAVNKMHLKRFRNDGFSLYIYGICRSCQSKTKVKKQNN